MPDTFRNEFIMPVKRDFAAEAVTQTYVSRVCERLQEEHLSLLEGLTNEEDIIVSVFLFDGTEVLVSEFDYSGTNMLIVKGKVRGKDATVFVHQSSLQVVFAKIPKEISQPRRVIGFARQENARALEPSEAQQE